MISYGKPCPQSEPSGLRTCNHRADRDTRTVNILPSEPRRDRGPPGGVCVGARRGNGDGSVRLPDRVRTLGSDRVDQIRVRGAALHGCRLPAVPRLALPAERWRCSTIERAVHEVLLELIPPGVPRRRIKPQGGTLLPRIFPPVCPTRPRIDDIANTRPGKCLRQSRARRGHAELARVGRGRSVARLAAEYVSVDGRMEMEDPEGKEEERGGWTAPYWNDELQKM